MLLVFCHLHTSFGGPDDVGVFETFGKVVDEQVLHHARFAVLLLDIDVVSVNVAIEHTFGNVQFRRCLLHGYEQCPELHLRLGGNDVLEIEGDATKHGTENDERTDDAEQGDACRLHGKELVLLAEVAEGHKSGQQDGKGERKGNQSQCRVEEELGQDSNFQTFTYQFVYISPQELHHEYEKADKECAREK